MGFGGNVGYNVNLEPPYATVGTPGYNRYLAESVCGNHLGLMEILPVFRGSSAISGLR